MIRTRWSYIDIALSYCINRCFLLVYGFLWKC